MSKTSKEDLKKFTKVTWKAQKKYKIPNGKSQGKQGLQLLGFQVREGSRRLFQYLFFIFID